MANFWITKMTTNKSEKSYTAIIAISICWMFYLYSYVARVEPSVLVNDLMNDFGITSSVVGFVISIMYIPYVFMQIPCGIITDKLGIKTMIVGSSALCALGSFVFGSAHSILQLEIGRFLIGLASASAFLCCGKVASDYFDKKKYAMLMGIAMCMGCFGGISGTAPTAFLVGKIGWRNTTYIIATVGIILALCAVIFMKQKKSAQTDKKTKLLDGVKILAKNPRAWILGFYGAMTYLPLSALAELWSVPFMEQRFSIPTEKAAIPSIIIFIGFGLGGVISAWVAEKINSYKKTIIMFTVGVILSFWVALYNDSIGFYSCLTAMFIGGVCAGANTLAFVIAYNLVPPQFGGTSAGFTNALIMSSGIIFQPLLGKLLDFFRNGMVTENGTPIYTLTMYRSAFLFVIVGMLLAIFATFFINDIKHKEEA